MDTLLIIDLELGKKLACANEENARMLLKMLYDMIPEHEEIILKSYQDKDMETLLFEVHKLHGGVSYCGTPRLKKTASELELALKHEEPWENLYHELVQEIEAFKKEYIKFSS
jgi:two-component system sensor histidine kinase BarA